MTSSDGSVAANLPDVAENLSATPGSAVDIRARLALDRAAAAVWVLATVGENTTGATHHLLHDPQDTTAGPIIE